jgi:hypothetical protein
MINVVSTIYDSSKNRGSTIYDSSKNLGVNNSKLIPYLEIYYISIGIKALTAILCFTIS